MVSRRQTPNAAHIHAISRMTDPDASQLHSKPAFRSIRVCAGGGPSRTPIRPKVPSLLSSTLHPYINLPSIVAPHLACFHPSSRPPPPASPQLGNGLRSETRKASINSRIRLRRARSFPTSASISLRSPPYHSGGTSFAADHTTSDAIVSNLVSHGSNESHPRNPRYTRFR